MLSDVEFFKIQAKHFHEDWKTFISNSNKMWDYSVPFEHCRYFDDDIFLHLYVPKESWEEMHETCCLMRSQHYVAYFAGFSKWDELIKASPIRLKAARIIYAVSTQYSFLPEAWIDFQKEQHLEIVDDNIFLQKTQEFFKRDLSAEEINRIVNG